MRLLAPALALLLAGCWGEPARAPVPVASTPTPHPNSITGQLSRPWRHVGGGVTGERFAQDKAKCNTLAAAASDGNEVQSGVTFINCLKAAGYEPHPISPQ